MIPNKPYAWACNTLILCSLIASCSSSSVVLVPDRFETEVLSDGSKRFVFEVNFGPTAGRADRRSGALDRTSMESALEGYFEQNPFCQEGYFLYDQGFNGRAYTMLGECQESADVSSN